jgi:hypothetical protein
MTLALNRQLLSNGNSPVFIKQRLNIFKPKDIKFQKDCIFLLKLNIFMVYKKN